MPITRKRARSTTTGPVFGDFGTAWTKILCPGTGGRIVLPAAATRDRTVDAATGRNAVLHAPIRVNELVALARGAHAVVGVPGASAVVLDVGARDMKWIRLSGRGVGGMDWNSTCGALAGFTLEILGRHFSLDFRAVKPAKKEIPLTCGVIGMERIFDRIAGGEKPDRAVAEFTRGLASLAHSFAGRPHTIYLSGGMCENPLFLKSFPRGVKVIPLGRFVLLDGVAAEYASVRS